MKKNVLATIFIFLALVFVIIGLVGSWYNTHMKMSIMNIDMEMNSDITLTSMYSTSDMGGQKTNQSLDLPAIREQYEEAGMDISFLDALENTFIITIVALIFAIIAIIFAILSKFKQKFQMISGIFSILLFIIMLIAPILFMLGFTSFIEAQAENFGVSETVSQIGFWFSKSEGGYEMSMGPGYAWYIMIIGAIFSLIASILLFIKNKQPISDVTSNPENPIVPVQ